MTRGQDIETREAEAERQERATQEERATEGGSAGAVSDQADARGTPHADLGSGRERVGRAGGPGAAHDSGEEVNLLELAAVLLKRWKLVFGLPLSFALAAALLSFVLPARYTATTTFVPEAEPQGVNMPSGLAGLASQFGVSVPGASNSPEFYADVIRSRTLKDQILLAGFADPRAEQAADSATLLEILGIRGSSEAQRLEEGREELEEATSIAVNNETNMVTVSVDTRYPELSAVLANRYVDLLNRFNLETRQSAARERREMIENRLATARDELRAAEERLKTFLEGNRLFEQSPELNFRYERLRREVNTKQEVVLTLSRQYEESRIQEVNDTPVITVVDRAVPPAQRSSPRTVLNVVLALVVGGAFGVLGAFGGEFVERARREDEEEFEELSSRWAALRAELRGLFRRSG